MTSRVDRVGELTMGAEDSAFFAKGKLKDDGFLVLKGSRISEKTGRMFETTDLADLRRGLIDKGIVADRIFTEDYLFSSPNDAAAVVYGTICSGGLMWVLDDGTPLANILKDLRRGKI
ncbi:MAG: DUF4357 domain-containing protein [Candidatus Methanomethylophilaceae archaeon]|nr:DUF4357 domain-containing protein [Candidatus Methanomethylophilaceae archaeon]